MQNEAAAPNETPTHAIAQPQDTEVSPGETPQTDKPGVEIIIPPEGLQNMQPFAADNASELFEVNPLNVGAPVVSVFFSPEVEGYSLWVAVWDDIERSSRLERWNIYTARVIGELASGDIQAPKSLSGTPDGALLVTTDESNVVLWDILSGPLVFEIDPSPWLKEALVAPANYFVLAVGYASVDGTVVLIDLDTNQTLNVFRHGDYVSDIDFSSDGRYLVSGAADGSVKVIDVEELSETFTFQETGWVDSVALELSPADAGASGLYLATSVSGGINLWDGAYGAAFRSLAGHAALVESMDFSPNGEVLASGDRSGAVVLWNTVTGEAIRALWPDMGEIAQLSFSPDGTLLAAATLDGYVIVWAVGP